MGYCDVWNEFSGAYSDRVRAWFGVLELANISTLLYEVNEISELLAYVGNE